MCRSPLGGRMREEVLCGKVGGWEATCRVLVGDVGEGLGRWC